MAARFIQDEPYLAKDRVIDLAFPDLVVCSLCQGIAWLPIACKWCEKPYCLSCIEAWQKQAIESTPCPTPCKEFRQRLCPPAIIHILSALEVTCRYRPNGCTETLPYDHLETHEEACGYRPIICSGCDTAIVKKDFNGHYNTCLLVLLTCHECNSVYKRQHESEHTEIKCLRVQLRQVQERRNPNEQNQEEQLNLLRSQVNDLMGIIQQLSI